MRKLLLGGIAGDIIGSIYEFNPVRFKDFELFKSNSTYTDDTVMTIANAEWLLSKGVLMDIMRKYGHKYPGAGYGGMFYDWLKSRCPKPYNSFGNGSAMRVSPVGWAFDTLEDTLEAAKQSAEITHNHPEGIKGAQATAACIFMARTGKSKQEIKENLDWDAISHCVIDDSITDNMIEAFKDKLNWSELSSSRYITSELLDKYADKWDWEVIINNWNQNYYHSGNLWSKSTAVEFYERYKEYIPGEKLQDSMLWRCMIYERKKQLFTVITA